MTVSRRILSLAVLASLTTLVPAAAGETVATQVTLMIGAPGEPGAGVEGALVVPGAVLPLPLLDRPHLAGQDATTAGKLTALTDRLAETLRLSDVHVSYRFEVPLQVGVRHELPPPSRTSDLSLEVELLGLGPDTATYQVHFFERSAVVADPRIVVARGGRALVGGVDGEDAPYVFLLLEPQRQSQPEPLSKPDGAFVVAGDVTPPIAFHRVHPKYTQEARKERVQGVVIVQTLIDARGEVADVRVLRGLPLGLTESATEALRQWRFEPATLNGEPVEVYYNLTINFRLDDGDEEHGPHEPGSV